MYEKKLVVESVVRYIYINNYIYIYIDRGQY